MSLRDPVIMALLSSAIATLFVILDRRRRSRLTALDRFATRHGMSCERLPDLVVLAPLEPLGLVPPVVAVERLVSGVLSAGPMKTAVTLLSCLCGNRHKARPFLLGIFAGPPDLPTLRLIPTGEHEVREDLGFVPMPASGLPPGYRAEAFSPLSRRLTEALGVALSHCEGFHVELRPGRLLLATADGGAQQIERLMELGLRILATADGPQTEEPAAAAGPGGLLN